MRVTILLPPILRPWKAHWAAIELRKQRAKLATSSRPLAELWFRADAPAGRASSTWSRSRLHRTFNDFAASQGLRILCRFLVRAELLRYWFQRGIKLHEGMFDGRVVFVTLPAGIFGIGLGRFRAFIEVEIGPLVRESGFVLHFHTVSHEIGLKVSDFVDRHLNLRSP